VYTVRLMHRATVNLYTVDLLMTSCMA